MHELAFIQELVDNVLAQAKQNRVTEVTLIKLAVGKLSGALPHALEFGFNAIKMGTELETTKLIITEINPVLCCTSCEHVFSPGEFFSLARTVVKQMSTLLKDRRLFWNILKVIWKEIRSMVKVILAQKLMKANEDIAVSNRNLLNLDTKDQNGLDELLP